MSNNWSSIINDATSLRHTLHRNPELTWQEENTAARIRQQLDQLGISWRSCSKTGTVATLAGHADGEHVALRCDIDALPIDEQVEIPFRSQHTGCMHACGHDGHTAVLWATAAWLKQHEEQLSGPVSLLFQPAEEGGHGARKMIEDGALEGVDVIYGWHNWPAIPFGKAVCPDGAIMAGNATFNIELLGRGGHASQPEACADPVLAASAITLNLQQIVSRKLPPQASAVVSVTSIDARSQLTVIPETVTMGGSIRFSEAFLFSRIETLITQIAIDTARSYGVTATVDIQPCYKATINHASPAQQFRTALADEFGESWHMSEFPVPIMGSEDFSYYLNEVPGAYALIGMAQDDHFQYSCHSPHYQFNDNLLAPVVRIYARLAKAPLP
jgi:hippurate hydrolase